MKQHFVDRQWLHEHPEGHCGESLRCGNLQNKNQRFISLKDLCVDGTFERCSKNGVKATGFLSKNLKIKIVWKGTKLDDSSNADLVVQHVPSKIDSEGISWAIQGIWSMSSDEKKKQSKPSTRNSSWASWKEEENSWMRSKGDTCQKFLVLAKVKRLSGCILKVSSRLCWCKDAVMKPLDLIWMASYKKIRSRLCNRTQRRRKARFREFHPFCNRTFLPAFQFVSSKPLLEAGSACLNHDVGEFVEKENDWSWDTTMSAHAAHFFLMGTGAKWFVGSFRRPFCILNICWLPCFVHWRFPTVPVCRLVGFFGRPLALFMKSRSIHRCIAEAHNLEFLPNLKFWPFLGRPLTDVTTHSVHSLVSCLESQDEQK